MDGCALLSCFFFLFGASPHPLSCASPLHAPSFLFFFSSFCVLVFRVFCTITPTQDGWRTMCWTDKPGPAHPSMPFVPCVSENQDTYKESKAAKGDLCCGYLAVWFFDNTLVHVPVLCCIQLCSHPWLVVCLCALETKTKPNCPMRWYTIQHHHHSHPILLHGMVFFPFAPNIFCVFLPKANNGLGVCCSCYCCCCYCCYFASLRFACMPNFI